VKYGVHCVCAIIGTARTNQRTQFPKASGFTPVLWLGSSNEEGEYYTAVLGIFPPPLHLEEL
jgi:hypothetical protein